MAYQVRQRDPLFDRDTQAVLERRGKELLGVGLMVLAVLAAMILGSYSQDDPSWLSATEEPAENLLGRFGASLAQPAYVIVGWGAWAVPLVFLVWGLRFLMHRGDDRALNRAIFAPIAVAVASVYAATHVPSAGWTHSFGMGGLFGDTVLGAVLNILPLGSGLALKMLSLLVGAGMLAMLAFVLGFTRPELLALGRFLLVGVVLTYAGALRLGSAALATTLHMARSGGQAMAGRAAEWSARRQARKPGAAAWAEDGEPALPPASPAMTVRPAAERQAAVSAAVAAAQARRPTPILRSAAAAAAPHPMPGLPEDEPWEEEPEAHPAIAAYQPVARQAAARPSLLSRVPSFLKRQPAAARPLDEAEPLPDDDDPIRARIARAISARQKAAQAPQRAEPPVTRPKGPRPILFDKTVYTHPKGPRIPPAPAMGVTLAAAAEAPDAGAFGADMDGDYRDDAYDEAMQALDAFEAETAALRQDEPEAGVLEAGEDDPDAVAAAGYTPSYGVPIPDAKKVVQHPARKPILPSRQARAEAQPRLSFDDRAAAFECPPLSLLSNPDTIQRHHLSDEALEENARMLENVLDDYGVRGEIVSVRPGPVVTMYELEPAPGLKASRVIGLADDIARSMSALSARVSTVPGRSVIGIELPNQHREKVVLREILSARDFGDSQMRLPLALGKDIGGEPVIANLAKMPHLLIAGTTGSGKSVAINTMILSLLYKLTPEECRLIMIDPKMLELSVYDGIPHLLSPVVTDPKKAVVALKWVVGEMEERYRKMSKMGVRNIDGYNGRVREALANGEMFRRTIQTGFDDETGDPVFETEEFEPQPFPYIVVIVDEMADLMMVAGKEIEACIQRLAQMARASGIHLIMATQRPSVDVITGTIKANFPTRISFQVTSKIDSRTILGEQGAEQLLGMGDMLYMAGGGRISRVHGPFVSDEEVEEVVNHLKSFGPPEYVGGVVEGPDEGERGETSVDELLGLASEKDGDEALYDMAVAIVAKDRKCSTSYIQRKLAIGYNKAARLVEQMETNGVVSPANAVGKREILVPEA